MTTHITRDQLSSVVTIHQRAFPGFFLTSLGPAFLREYYRTVTEYPGGILLGDRTDATLNGFVAGFVAPAGFYRMLRGRRAALAFAALGGVILKPTRLITALQNYRRTTTQGQSAADSSCAELSSLAVSPDRSGSGVGKRLVDAFVDEARARGAERVVLTTDTHGNDRVNGFYAGQEFSLTRTFEARPGRWLNEYVRDLNTSATGDES